MTYVRGFDFEGVYKGVIMARELKLDMKRMRSRGSEG